MRMKKSISILLVLVMALALFMGCSPTVEESKGEIAAEGLYPMEIVDGLGNTVTIPKMPERIISVAPSITEILYALGVEDKILAVSDFCDYPAAALEKEKVGSSWTINTEKIIELTPDIVFVFGEGQEEANQQIVDTGITIVKFEPESIEEILSAIGVIGQMTGTEEKANALAEEMNAKKAALLEKVKDQPKKRVFYQVWDEPIMTAGPGSFIDELITLAGGINVAADAGEAWPMYSAEALVENNPEVYILPAHIGGNMALSTTEIEVLIDGVKARPGYEAISAVENDRIEPVEPNIVSRPGVRIIEALELFVKAIHPELN